MTSVISDVWHNSKAQLDPGSVLFQSDRRFQFFAYGVSHSQLMFRSTPLVVDQDSTIDLVFKPVTALKIRDVYRGLTIRCATEEEFGLIKALSGGDVEGGERIFILESDGVTDYVISLAVGWREDVLRRTRQSLFAYVSEDMPRWPTQPLDGFHMQLNVASVRDLIDAMNADDQQVRRERYRTVYVVMTRVDRRGVPDISGAGVFLTEADAEDALAYIAPKVVDCWIEPLPIAI
ncbi:hypothetical protein [Planotetraspora silvatica]|nr:hypothetical protein [Planotetraspora silvatica]